MARQRITKSTLDLTSIRELELSDLKYWAFVFRIRLYKIIHPKTELFRLSHAVGRLDSTRFIKCGPGSCVRFTEALTMHYVASNTTIPVPRLLDVFKFKRNNFIYIIQEFIDCPVLEDVWHRLSEEDQLSSMKELKGYLDQLRALPPPDPQRVQAIDGGVCIDERINHGEWGPFATHREFQQRFGYGIIENDPKKNPEAPEPLAKLRGRMWRTVLTHGDLGPHNILWNVKEKHIAAIIDWERSGWLPEYWEYCRSGSYARMGCPSWWELFTKVVDTYPDEYVVERLLDSYFTRV